MVPQSPAYVTGFSFAFAALPGAQLQRWHWTAGLGPTMVLQLARVILHLPKLATFYQKDS